MLQSDLYRSVSRATGESVSTIRRIGFLIADPTQPIDDPEADSLGPHVIDWDEFQTHQEEMDAHPSIDCA